MIYQMQYYCEISGITEDETDVYVYNLRITENGIIHKESLNATADELSIFVPKKNAMRNMQSVSSDSYTVFGDFESNNIKRGDKVNLTFGYITPSIDENNNKSLLYNKSINEYVVNEVVIGANEVEIKCINYMYFLNNSSVTETFGKKITISQIAEKLEDIINNQIEKYNAKIDKIRPNDEFAFLYKFPLMGRVIQDDFDLTIYLSSNKINVSDVLKNLAEKYFINTRIINITEKKIDGQGDELNIQTQYLILAGDWLKSFIKIPFPSPLPLPMSSGGRMLEKGREERKVSIISKPVAIRPSKIPSNEHFFSDIPQRLLINTLGEKEAKKYHKIIERDDFILQNEKTIKLKVVAKVYNRDNTVTEITSDLSKIDGNIVSYKFYNPFPGKPDEKYYKAVLDAEIKKLTYTGFKQGSSFTTFGYPVVQPGDKITLDGIGTIRLNHTPQTDIIDPTIFIRKSVYFVETVETTFDENGWRQRIGISVKIPQANEYSIIDKIYANSTIQTTSDLNYDIIEQARDIQIEAIRKQKAKSAISNKK